MKKILDSLLKDSISYPEQCYKSIKDFIIDIPYPNDIAIIDKLITILREKDKTAKSENSKNLLSIQIYLFHHNYRRDKYFNTTVDNSFSPKNLGEDEWKDAFRRGYKSLFDDFIESLDFLKSNILIQNKRNEHKLKWVADHSHFSLLLKTLFTQNYIKYPDADKKMVAKSLLSLFDFSEAKNKLKSSTIENRLRKLDLNPDDIHDLKNPFKINNNRI